MLKIQNKDRQNPGHYETLTELGNSLVVQWLGLGTFTLWPGVQSLFGKLRSRKSYIPF